MSSAAPVEKNDRQTREREQKGFKKIIPKLKNNQQITIGNCLKKKDKNLSKLIRQMNKAFYNTVS